MNNIMKAVVSSLVLLILILIGLWFSGVFINTTISYPVGLYRSHKIMEGQDLSSLKGEMVLFCPDENNLTVRFADRNNFLMHGSFCGAGKVAPLIKTIVGVPGDRVRVKREGVYIDNTFQKNSKRVNSHLKKLSFRDNFVKVLTNNEYWIMSDYDERSFDSRYFGAVKRDQIRKSITPLLLF